MATMGRDPLRGQRKETPPSLQTWISAWGAENSHSASFAPIISCKKKQLSHSLVDKPVVGPLKTAESTAVDPSEASLSLSLDEEDEEEEEALLLFFCLSGQGLLKWWLRERLK